MLPLTAFALLTLAIAPSAGPTAAERKTILDAAGFKPVAGKYLTCDRKGAPEIELRDLNGDGRPEALVTDNGIECFGRDETGFTLATRGPDGRWTKLYNSPGIAQPLPSRFNGWPEIEVGGAGFCFPVLRWTGKTYAVARHQYEGKACRP